MNLEAIGALLELGLNLAVNLTESHSGKPVEQMSSDEIKQAVESISLRPVAELVALGEAQARKGGAT